MILFGLIYLVIVLYASLAYGTYLKFKKNGINPVGHTKITVFFFPALLFCIHLFIAITFLFKKPTYSLFIMKKILFNYPELIGVFIEVILEKKATEFAQEHLHEKLTTNKKIRKVATKTKALNLDDLDPSPSQILKRYRNVLAPA
ncbi:hypothetical protein PU629_07315 [Pullulanibacillus sp. KACC 23026]|uniref:hypothetical protein n=1 Tax=Pullulanibacillus sp. KACC 23026 TaxID=3028315 RepID=UPI0023AF5EE6|nr:hypothetical protein [Pullulanibacillus sp. KACC 23026]WEG14166.1 hypothetical protein PU629_07315 [Pullulanibacillus sp. KACC 23026]